MEFLSGRLKVFFLRVWHLRALLVFYASMMTIFMCATCELISFCKRKKNLWKCLQNQQQKIRAQREYF